MAGSKNVQIFFLLFSFFSSEKILFSSGQGEVMIKILILLISFVFFPPFSFFFLFSFHFSFHFSFWPFRGCGNWPFFFKVGVCLLGVGVGPAFVGCCCCWPLQEKEETYEKMKNEKKKEKFKKKRRKREKEKKENAKMLRCRCCDDHFYTDHHDLLSYVTIDWETVWR